VSILVLMFVFSGGVVCTILFKSDEFFDTVEGSRDWWGTVPASMFTLLRIMTLEWVEVVRPTCEYYVLAYPLLVSFLVIAGLGILNLFTAIFVESLLIASTDMAAQERMRLLAQRVQLEENLLALFQVMDADQSGTLNLEEVAQVINMLHEDDQISGTRHTPLQPPLPDDNFQAYERSNPSLCKDEAAAIEMGTVAVGSVGVRIPSLETDKSWNVWRAEIKGDLDHFGLSPDAIELALHFSALGLEVGEHQINYSEFTQSVFTLDEAVTKYDSMLLEVYINKVLLRFSRRMEILLQNHWSQIQSGVLPAKLVDNTNAVSFGYLSDPLSSVFSWSKSVPAGPTTDLVGPFRPTMHPGSSEEPNSSSVGHLDRCGMGC